MTNKLDKADRRQENGAALIWGSVLGVILGGAALAGIGGWMLYAQSAESENVTRAESVVPTPFYASPPTATSPPAAAYPTGGYGGATTTYGSYPTRSPYESEPKPPTFGNEAASEDDNATDESEQPSYLPQLPTEEKEPAETRPERADIEPEVNGEAERTENEEG